MANEPEMKDPEAIRQRMEQTRTALTEKLETLENQVVQTVQGATSAVTETVESVKDAVHETVSSVKESVSDTVETVKDTFDLPLQVERHPWVMFGGSVAVGYLAGTLLPSIGPGRIDWDAMSQPAEPQGFRAAEPRGFRATEETVRPNGRSSQMSNWLGNLSQTFGGEIDKLKGLAIGTALGVARDFLVQSVPEHLGDQVRELMDNFTTKLGGQRIEGPILRTSHERSQDQGHAQEWRAPYEAGQPRRAT
jgi:ElaB/YqjD/DUF883 family membrane-anchored ribosome-binding protein